MTLHTGKPVKCDYPGCEKRFARSSYLILHRRDHTNERKYSCDRCSQQYKQKSHLDRHIEATHLLIKHKCNYEGCNKEFTKSWSLKQHQFTHNIKQLPHKCSLCKSAFIRKDKLRKHMAISHRFTEVVSEEIVTTQNDEKVTQEFIISDEISEIISTAAPNTIFTIQNADGTLTEVKTLEMEA
jgi:uncharacterized Zn-finger protein